MCCKQVSCNSRLCQGSLLPVLCMMKQAVWTSVHHVPIVYNPVVRDGRPPTHNFIIPSWVGFKNMCVITIIIMSMYICKVSE